MRKFKIVLAEDDTILAKVIYEELKEAGFEVWHADNGVTGLELIRSKRPDLVLLDVLMPQKEGFDVLAELKQSPATSAIPVIILTMLGSDDDIKKGLRLGANDYIVKSQHAVAEIVDKVRAFFGEESHPEAEKLRNENEKAKSETASKVKEGSSEEQQGTASKAEEGGSGEQQESG